MKENKWKQNIQQKEDIMAKDCFIVGSQVNVLVEEVRRRRRRRKEKLKGAEELGERVINWILVEDE